MRGLEQLRALREELQRTAEKRAEEVREQQQIARERAEEQQFFRQSIGPVAPLKTPAKAARLTPLPPPIPVQRLQDEQKALAQSLSDEFDPESLLDTDDSLSWYRPPLGADVARKLRKGHWVIQDQLDLHGARSDEARECVTHFLTTSLKRGVRCIRIIHGKGYGSPDRQPVLKGKVRKWLMQHDAVIAFCQAKPADGGAGALIVLLKATR